MGVPLVLRGKAGDGTLERGVEVLSRQFIVS